MFESASADADALVVGIDANAAGLRDGLRRARKAKLPNAVFLVAGAEALPGPLAGAATEVRIQFPWGSLLTALLGGDRHIVGGIAALLRPGGSLTLLTSVIERDGVEGIARLDEATASAVAERLAAATDDLRLVSVRTATASDLAGAHSTWAKRLGVGSSRPAWLLEHRRPPDPEPGEVDRVGQPGDFPNGPGSPIRST